MVCECVGIGGVASLWLTGFCLALLVCYDSCTCCSRGNSTPVASCGFSFSYIITTFLFGFRVTYCFLLRFSNVVLGYTDY